MAFYSLGEVLGSGQFGTVMKGEWLKEEEEKKEEVEVAVKMLKKGSHASSTVKFLREAAIMGQFNHPNVVKLHGVATEGEPVRFYGCRVEPPQLRQKTSKFETSK